MMLFATGFLLLSSGIAPGLPTPESDRIVIYAENVYTSTGDTIENGAITIENGKFQSIVSRKAPKGEDVIRAVAITAGLIDASPRLANGFDSVEQSREIQPHLRVADSIDIFAPAWKRQLRNGITTVLVSPRDENVIGGLGVVMKTGGENSVAKRTVRADAVLRGAIGSQPSLRNHPARGSPTDFYSRRPTTRMGVEWEWRKAFYDAAASAKDESRAFPGSEQLVAALKGELPVMIQGWATQDIRTAVFLKEELQGEGLGELRLIVDAAAEAWREPELLVRSKAAVILPPHSTTGRRLTDGAFMPWNVAKLMHDQGIPFAISGHGARSVELRLNAQVATAIRGGLPFEAALEAVTLTPARLLGVEDRVGSIEVGKDADLTLWSGTPFAYSSRVIGVVLDGELEIDPR